MGEPSILMINYEFPPIGGGAGNACYYLLKELAKRHIHVDLITSGTKTSTQQFAKTITIHHIGIKKKNLHHWTAKELLTWSLKAHRITGRLLKQKDYDLCHCWFGWPCGVIGYLYRKHLPYIVALRGSDVPGYNQRLKHLDMVLFRPLSKIIWSKAEHVIANSEDLQHLANKTSAIPIPIIPNGIATDEFRPIKRKASNILRIISVGRLIPRKGFDQLIRGLHGLKHCRLTIVGDGPKKHALMHLATSLNVPLTITGVVPHADMPSLYQKHDLFVLMSKNEGMSNALLEAMACGLAIFTTDVGGASKLISANGRIIKTPSDLHKTIADLDDDTLSAMGKASRDAAMNHSWATVAESYSKLYHDITSIVGTNGIAPYRS
jgi:glycosyltransferase involved in cell wall biosynthesis